MLYRQVCDILILFMNMYIPVTLIQLQVLIVKEEIVTASEPDRNFIICCVLWARFWVVDTESNSATWNIHIMECEHKSQIYTYQDGSFTRACCVQAFLDGGKVWGCSLLQLWHYHNYTYTLMLLLIARTKFSDFSDQRHYRKNKYSQLMKFQ